MTVTTNNVYVASATGALKGVSVGNDAIGIKTAICNCVKNKSMISNKNEVTCMSWGDEDENEILIGMKNKVKSYNVISGDYLDEVLLDDDEACGIFKQNSTLFVGLKSGSVRTWKCPYEEKQFHDMKVGGCIERMRHSKLQPHVIATGGKENDLKLWDINTSKLIFNAKNIKPDELQLRIPVWCSDITFFEQNEKVAYCSRHGDIRLFDPRLPQRRPVLNMHNEDQTFTCIAQTPYEHNLLSGTGSGDLHLIDLRGKVFFVGKYKGFAGAVKSVATCSIEKPLVFSASLDRHFRIHDFRTRKLIVKEYLQSRLTTVLVKKDFQLQAFASEEEMEEAKSTNFQRKRKNKIIEEEEEEEDEKLDEIFDNLETIEEVINNDKPTEKKKKRKSKIVVPSDETVKPKTIKWKKDKTV